MSVTAKHIQSYLPGAIDGLLELALDLRYTWSHRADAIWERLNPELWSITRNPWLVLQSLSLRAMNELADDAGFVEQVNNLLIREQQALQEPGWFEQTYSKPPVRTIAYFSMEFGLSESLPIYSGGLGLLAGDLLKAANDLRVPVVGIGILYQNGYFRQAMDAQGNQIALYPSNNLNELPVTPVRDKNGDLLRLDLKLPGYRLKVRVWQASIGRITLYLLDTNDPVNHPIARCITTELYGGGQEQRLQQEILLGIGGWRVLQALDIQPEICHLNEGHAAFAVMDRARSYMKLYDVDFNTALTITRAGNIFTTHTPVVAGFDCFPVEMMRRYFCSYVNSLSISFEAFLALGQRDHDTSDNVFNMAYLAVHGSSAVNGVSQLHGEVSRQIFAPLFPGWPIQEVPVGYVTNGVHVPTWDSAKADLLWTEKCGKQRWAGDVSCIEENFKQVSDEALWILRMQNRKALVDYVREDKARQLATQGLSRVEATDQARRLFDPNILTLGFARRFATYKRPTLLLHDPERLVRILTNPERPIQLVIAGKAHPADTEGQAMLRDWFQFMQRPEVCNHVIFIGDYNMLVAEQLVAGVDVWLNNPRRPWEASGTSGMKVLVNGGLNLSELDGWWAEAYSPEVGWAIGDGQEHNSDPVWDAHEAEQIYELLENEIAPEFYHRDMQGIPLSWVARMRSSMARLTPYYSTNRMLQQYLDKYYIPCAKNYLARSARQGEFGLELQTWLHEVDQCWSSMHIGESLIEKKEDKWAFKIPVYLGEMNPQSVRVQLYAQSLFDHEAPAIYPMHRDQQLAGTSNGFLYTATIDNNRSPQDFTARIVPVHKGASVPLELNRIMWQK